MVGASHVYFWQTPSWNWAEFWALLILLAVSLVPIEVPRKRREVEGNRITKRAALIAGLLNGRDGRWSTSKASTVLWTYAVWFAFITILLHTNGKGLEHAVLKQQYLLLLGIPIGTAVVAKGITQSKVDSGKVSTKQPDGVETKVLNGIGQLVANDQGQPDLLDFQYFGFNLILLGYFFTKFLGNEAFGLPELPETLVALSGVSAAGYVGKKGVQQEVNPVITAVDPSPAPARGTITIRGGSLAAAGATDVSVLIGDLTVTPSDVTDTRIVASLPAALKPGKVTVRVVNQRGMTSDPYPLEISN
jgi:IPT/TIG domain